MLVTRRDHVEEVGGLLKQFRVVAIVGARQVGKTTLARSIAAAWRGSVTYLDLEDPAHLRRLSDPMLALRGLEGLVVIDELQRVPELFPVLRVLADRPKSARFLVLGSAAPSLLQQASESLAGRIAYHELRGFSLDEAGSDRTDRLWLRGGYPLSYLARSDDESFRWRREYLRTFLERDVPQFGFKVPSETLRRLWSMLAHTHGGVLNNAELGRSMGMSAPAVRHHLEILQAAYVVRLLPPFAENLAKRQVKAPKVYVVDAGLLHVLLGIHSGAALVGHPKAGASWEGFALSEVLTRLRAFPEEAFFWATHQGAELDLLVLRGRRRLGYEFKLSSAPEVTKSMRIAIDDLKLDSLDVVHAGDETYALADGIRALSLRRLAEDLKPPRR